MRQNGFAAGAGVATDQAFDVDGRFGLEQNQRVEPVGIVHPVFDSELLLCDSFAAASGDLLNHLHLRRS